MSDQSPHECDRLLDLITQTTLHQSGVTLAMHTVLAHLVAQVPPPPSFDVPVEALRVTLAPFLAGVPEDAIEPSVRAVLDAARTTYDGVMKAAAMLRAPVPAHAEVPQ